MNISEKRKTALYAAIHEPIMDRRVRVKRVIDILGEGNADNIDAMLYTLEREIWNEVKKTLNIKDP